MSGGCKKQIPWGAHSTYSSPCQRKAIAGGEGYCKQHSPDEVEKRYKASEAKAKAVREKRRQQYCGPDAIRALKSMKVLLEKGMPQSALDVAEAWLNVNKF